MPSAFSVSQEEIDHILRVGSNTENARMKIVTEFSKHAMDYADILKAMYHGGYGIETGAGILSAWYAEDGIHLARGIEAEHAADAQDISWVDAAKRVNELLAEGRFATNVEIAEAPGFERRELAQSILYLAHDLSDEAMERGLLATYRSSWNEGYPAQTEKIAAMLADPETRDALVEEYRQFMVAWRAEPDVLRFRFYRPASLMNRLNELKLPRQEYRSDMAEMPEIRHRITEDEIAHVFIDASADRKLAVYDFWQKGHSAKEKEKFIRGQYGTGGHSNALSKNFHSFLDYEGKGMRFRKPDCGTIEQRWSKIVRRLDDLIANGRYLTPEELEKYQSNHLEQSPEQGQEPEQSPEQSEEPGQEQEHEQEPAAPAEFESVEVPPMDTDTQGEIIFEENETEANVAQEAAQDTAHGFPDYATLKMAHEDDVVLFQVGDFYEIYGYEAKAAAEILDLAYTMRKIPGLGHVYMCGFPVADLEKNLAPLRDKYDVIVSGISAKTGERIMATFLSVDHEAELAIDAHEREYGADGTRVFRDREAKQEAPVPKREITQDDIDNAIRAWNGNIQSKQAVVRHMEMYARDKKTAEWLSMEYNARADEPFHIAVDGAEMDMPWPKVQRRIAQLIKADRFYTEAEIDRFDDVDPVAVREKLEQGGESPFVRQVMDDVEQIAQEQQQEQGQSPESESSDTETKDWEYVERQKFLAGLDLTDEQFTIVRAMETAGRIKRKSCIPRHQQQLSAGLRNMGGSL